MIIYTHDDPSGLELDKLAYEAMEGFAYCAKQESIQIESGDDPDFDGTDFFYRAEDTE